MNTNEIIEEFNSYCIQFLDFIYEITKNTDVTFYKKAINMVNNANKSKILEQFILYCYQYKEYVVNKDKDFFVNTDFSDKCNEKSLLHVIKIRDLFNTLDNEVVEHVFQYLLVLCSLVESYIKQTNILNIDSK